jgi:hypothetical protein
VAAGGVGEAGRFGPPLDHSQDVVCIHPIGSQIVSLTDAAEQPALLVFVDSSGFDKRIEVIRGQ